MKRGSKIHHSLSLTSTLTDEDNEVEAAGNTDIVSHSVSKMRTLRADNIPLKNFDKLGHVREHSYPFLTGDTLRAAQTWVLDETVNNIDA